MPIKRKNRGQVRCKKMSLHSLLKGTPFTLTLRARSAGPPQIRAANSFETVLKTERVKPEPGVTRRADPALYVDLKMKFTRRS